jgi:hypothetical protein
MSQVCTQKYCHVYTPNHPICNACPVYYPEPIENKLPKSKYLVITREGDIVKVSFTKRVRKDVFIKIAKLIANGKGEYHACGKDSFFLIKSPTSISEKTIPSDNP